MNELHLFAGAGGGILGGQILGHRTVCAVELDPYARSVLVARQNDRSLPPFPIWDDVCTFDGTPWRGIVDVVCGGFPCQDISAAGKGAGITGERSGLWKEFARIIGEVRPSFVFVENSPMLTIRGLGTVLGDLAAMGFDAEWGVLSAANVGANHRRERVWILGYTNNDGQTTAEVGSRIKSRSDNHEARQEQTGEFTRSGKQYSELADPDSQRTTIGAASSVRRIIPNINGKRKTEKQKRELVECGFIGNSETLLNSDSAQREGNKCTKRIKSQYPDISGASWWSVEPNVGRVAHELAFRVDRLKAIGNGQVPLVAATAFKLLMERIK